MKINTHTFPSFLSLLLIAAVISAGCQKADDGKNKAAKKAAAAKPATVKDAAPPKPVEPPPKPTITKPKFTEQKAKTNLVKEGDAMPNAALQDLAGKPVELHSLFGKKLTVVCLWNAEGISGLQAISELEKYIAKPYAQKGVVVVGVNCGDPPQVVKEKAGLAGAKFAMLQDPSSDYFKKVATKELPRIYLLDAGGKILFFDIDYSRGTKRDLTQSIEVALTK